MIRNIFGILCLCAVGFLIIIIQTLAFVTLPSLVTNKLIMMGIYLIILLVFYLLGLALYKGIHWKTYTYLTIGIATVLSVAFVITINVMKGAKGSAKALNLPSLNFFEDYTMGAIVVLIFIGIGLYCYVTSKKKLIQIVKHSQS